MRFIYTLNIKSFSGYCLSFYMLLFAAIYICHEMSVAEFRSWFHFLNFAWGKGLFALFVGCMVLGSGSAVVWLDISVGSYLIIYAALVSIVSIVYRKNEPELVEEMLHEIISVKKMKNKAKELKTTEYVQEDHEESDQNNNKIWTYVKLINYHFNQNTQV